MIDRRDVYDVVDGERDYQDRKWGASRGHEVGAWIAIMETLLDDARRAWSENSGDWPALDEMRKVVAVGVACMEQHGTVRRRLADIDDRPRIDTEVETFGSRERGNF